MTALTLLLLALLALAARALYLEVDVACWDRLWRLSSGPVAVDLHRNAGMARLVNDSQDYPLPREFRVLLLRIGGVPVWSWHGLVALPREVDARISEVGPNEFDHLFDGPFRLNWSRSTMRKLYSAR